MAQKTKSDLNTLENKANRESQSDLTQQEINGIIALYSAGKLNEALREGQRLSQINSKTPFLHNILGAIHVGLGQLDAAVASCERALKLKPDYAEAHNNLGNVLRDLGQLDGAVSSCRQALKLKPGYAEAHNNLGNALAGLGQLEAAVTSYKQALKIKPDYVNAHNNLGNVLRGLDQLEAAEASNEETPNLEKKGMSALQDASVRQSNLTQQEISNLIALYSAGRLNEALREGQRLSQINSKTPLLHNILGAIHFRLGKLDAAVASCERALELKPDYAEAHNNLGNVLRDLGQLDGAVACYERTLELKPDYAEVHNNLGNAFRELGQVEAALTSYERAIRIKPNYAEAHCNLGTTLKDLGQLDDAILCIQKAISLDPNNSIFWDKFAHVLREGGSTAFGGTLSPYLLQALEQPSIRPSDISISIINTLRQHPNLQAAFKASRTGDFYKTISNVTRQLASIPLLLRLMELCPIPAPDIEQLLTQMRHAMLNQWPVENQDSQGLRFFKALAIHCFTNEYVFLECDEETQEIDRLQNKLKTLVEGRETIPATWVAILGAYRPLHIFSWSDQLKESGSVQNIKEILVRQIDEVREEQYLSLKIPRITSINNKVSRLVREQYEQSPYPRWINTGLYTKPLAVGEVLQELEVKLRFNKEQFSDSPDILIAGCGTGQHALSTASRFKDCNVLAVDLSLSSLSYAIRKTKELEVSNIEYMQADILELNSLERQFDIIESSGVLHHMHNPLAGWRVLVDLLRPCGLMKIGLYSDMAREPIVEARAFIEKKKYSTSLEDIRQCRAKIVNIPFTSNSKIPKVLKFRDFYSLSACRDLLFHVQEHRFTLLQIEIALKELGLEFIGFELSNAQIMKKFREIYPKENSPTLLPLWHQFELKNPDTFGGMYQFWVQKI